MTRRLKLVCLGSVAFSLMGALIACSDDDVAAGPGPSELDASNELDAPASARADVVDAGMERCSASKLCITDLPLSRKVSLSSVYGSSRTDVWAVGNQGLVAHYDGARWEIADQVVPDGSLLHTMRSVWLERPDDVWIADGDQIRHGTGWKGPSDTDWSFFEYPSVGGYVGFLPGVLHGRGNAIWVGHLLTNNGHPPLEKFTGWVDGGPGAPEGLDVYINEIRALATWQDDEVWLAGRCNRARSRGCAFRASVPSGEPDASLPEWQIENYDAKTAYPLTGAWAKDGVVWLVGEAGAIRRANASTMKTKTFEVLPSPVTSNLYGIFGFGPDDVWAVGEGSAVLHWNGTSWTKLATPYDGLRDKPRFESVWGSSPGDVWIVGDGAVLHFQENAP